MWWPDWMTWHLSCAAQNHTHSNMVSSVAKDRFKHIGYTKAEKILWKSMKLSVCECLGKKVRALCSACNLKILLFSAYHPLCSLSTICASAYAPPNEIWMMKERICVRCKKVYTVICPFSFPTAVKPSALIDSNLNEAACSPLVIMRMCVLEKRAACAWVRKLCVPVGIPVLSSTRLHSGRRHISSMTAGIPLCVCFCIYVTLPPPQQPGPPELRSWWWLITTPPPPPLPPSLVFSPYSLCPFIICSSSFPQFLLVSAPFLFVFLLLPSLHPLIHPFILLWSRPLFSFDPPLQFFTLLLLPSSSLPFLHTTCLCLYSFSLNLNLNLFSSIYSHFVSSTVLSSIFFLFSPPSHLSSTLILVPSLQLLTFFRLFPPSVNVHLLLPSSISFPQANLYDTVPWSLSQVRSKMSYTLPSHWLVTEPQRQCIVYPSSKG